LLTPQQRIEEAIHRTLPGVPVEVEPGSVCARDGVTFSLIEINGAPRLALLGKAGCARDFNVAQEFRAESRVLALCHPGPENAQALRRALPFTAPLPLGQKDATFGMGDRLGVAGPGHIRAIRAYRASPLLAQQSTRELSLTSRTFAEVLDAASWAVFREGFQEPWGADGDHLKGEKEVKAALSAGFTMVTADVSDFLRSDHFSRSDAEIAAAWERLDPTYRKDLEERYLDRAFPLAPGEGLRFAETDLRRIVLVYGDALEHGARLHHAAEAERGAEGFDFELSVDETEAPTTPQAHLFIAMEARRRGISLSSLAPRFVGEFQKAIDYIGSGAEFERSFAAHAAVARTLGHRVSVHSGSDKFSVFPSIGRLSGGRFHIKTSGTSWLEALRVIAGAEPAFFREVYARALFSYDTASRYYQVTPDLAALPEARGLGDREASRLLDDANARRVLHITYGEILADAAMKDRIFRILERERVHYWQALEAHLGKHLERLGVSRRGVDSG